MGRRECDGGGNTEQWDYDSGGQSDGDDDYGLGDSLGLAVRLGWPPAKAGGFFVGRFLSGLNRGKGIRAALQNGTAEGGCPHFYLLICFLGLHISPERRKALWGVRLIRKRRNHPARRHFSRSDRNPAVTNWNGLELGGRAAGYACVLRGRYLSLDRRLRGMRGWWIMTISTAQTTRSTRLNDRGNARNGCGHR